MWNNFEFLNPGFLWFLLSIPILAFGIFLLEKKMQPYLTMPSIKGFQAEHLFYQN